MSNETCRLITKEQYQEYMELKKQFADASKKVRWKPKQGDEFFCVDSAGKIEKSFFTPNLNADIFRYRIGNCFQTEEEAKKEFNRMIAERELLDMADGSLNGGWYEIEYIPKEDCFDYCGYSEISSSCYRFASKESARKAIDTLGTEKLKLIFRID